VRRTDAVKPYAGCIATISNDKISAKSATRKRQRGSAAAGFECWAHVVAGDAAWCFFSDRVNHDGLMARVAARVADERVLKLIRAYLKAEVTEDGLWMKARRKSVRFRPS
jgi:retron-type reverse transcriptase